jgi:two-component system, response regulator YesN
MNILLVDDEPIELDQLELLIHSHYPTWITHKSLTGSRAIRMVDEWAARGESFQLAFIDIKLPGRNGLEVASILKEKNVNLDLIVVSAFQDFHYAKESIKLKVFDYIVKPVIEKELLIILDKYVQEHPEFGMKSGLVEKVMAKIKEQYSEPLRLSTLAEEIHISPNYLSRLFSLEVGMSFSEFLLLYRIEMAKNFLVRQRHWSIQQVAEACGFSSQHHLSSSFKKHTKISPKDFRNMGVLK